MNETDYIGIISKCYKEILRREPDPAGLSHYLNMMREGKLDEQQLVETFKNSEEYKDIDLMNRFIEKYDLKFTKNTTRDNLKNKVNAESIPKNKTVVNFFWYGQDFGFLENIAIKSHIKVGHYPIIWLSGEKPRTKYWNEIEKMNNSLTIYDITENFNAKEFLEFGGDLRISSDLWRFHFLYGMGGIYCDTDVFALQKFPQDEWIVCSAEKENPKLLSIGLIKAPTNNTVFLNCISNLKKQWGGVKVFTDAYRKIFGTVNSTHSDELFYPFKWYEWQILFSEIDIPPTAFSVHFHTGALRYHLGRNLKKYDEKWCKENPNTLLGKLFKWLNEDLNYNYNNKENNFEKKYQTISNLHEQIRRSFLEIKKRNPELDEFFKYYNLLSKKNITDNQLKDEIRKDITDT